MEYRTREQFQAKMVMWRDVDAAMIAGWTHRSENRRPAEFEGFAAGRRKTRRHRRCAETQRRQFTHDCAYIYNCA